LKELNLAWTKIKSLPPEFAQLKKLEVLNIKYNDFNSFPEVIDQIPNLKLLIICHEEFDKNEGQTHSSVQQEQADVTVTTQ